MRAYIQHIPLLRNTLEMLPEGESSACAKALAALAFALRSTNECERIDALVDEAVAMAQRLDWPTQWVTLKMGVLALRGRPQTLPRRLELTRKFYEISERHGDHDLIAFAYAWLNMLESGQVAELEELFQRYSALTVTQFGLHEYYLQTCRITLALLRGEWSGLGQRIEKLRVLGGRTRPDDADARSVRISGRLLTAAGMLGRSTP